MDALALLIYAMEWGLIGIPLYFILGALPMPAWAITVTRIILIALGVLSVARVLMGAEPQRPITRLSPIPPAPPSIVGPSR